MKKEPNFGTFLFFIFFKYIVNCVTYISSDILGSMLRGRFFRPVIFLVVTINCGSPRLERFYRGFGFHAFGEFEQLVEFDTKNPVNEFVRLSWPLDGSSRSLAVKEAYRRLAPTLECATTRVVL
jgi:hypothetical protein